MWENTIRGRNFWSMETGNKDSQIWKQILVLRPQLYNSFSMQICNGLNTDLFFDPWIPDWRIEDDIPRHQWQMIGPHGAKVSSLLRNSNWELPPLPANSLAALWQSIKEVSIYPNQGADRLIWVNSKDGKYTVKEGMKLFTQLNAEVPWYNLIWHKERVPRFSMCAWRLIHKKLATLDLLKKRGIRLVSRYALCRKEEESMDHLFASCSFATWFWQVISSSWEREEKD